MTLVNFQTSVKTINKQANHDLKNLSNRLTANKISLNFSKTELVMFNPPKKHVEHELKIELNGKKLYQTYSVSIMEFILIKTSSERII